MENYPLNKLTLSLIGQYFRGFLSSHKTTECALEDLSLHPLSYLLRYLSGVIEDMETSKGYKNVLQDICVVFSSLLLLPQKLLTCLIRPTCGSHRFIHPLELQLNILQDMPVDKKVFTLKSTQLSYKKIQYGFQVSIESCQCLHKYLVRHVCGLQRFLYPLEIHSNVLQDTWVDIWINPLKYTQLSYKMTKNLWNTDQ